eukprot:sb/3469833/
MVDQLETTLKAATLSVSGTTTNSETLPGTATNSETLPGTATNSETLPGTATNSETLPGTATNSETLPGTATNSETLPGTTTETQPTDIGTDWVRVPILSERWKGTGWGWKCSVCPMEFRDYFAKQRHEVVMAKSRDFLSNHHPVRPDSPPVCCYCGHSTLDWVGMAIHQAVHCDRFPWFWPGLNEDGIMEQKGYGVYVGRVVNGFNSVPVKSEPMDTDS